MDGAGVADWDLNIYSPGHWNFYEPHHHLSIEVSYWELVAWRTTVDHGLNLYFDYYMKCHLQPRGQYYFPGLDLDVT